MIILKDNSGFNKQEKTGMGIKKLLFYSFPAEMEVNSTLKC